ncbi:MAG: AI-2E family transporter [Bacteroidota bacterium]|nr:AI-2E family transporter [Bacteroidota bacterium]MDP4206671.1 AI-2E family transporter [Bacteroidota bacterium]
MNKSTKNTLAILGAILFAFLVWYFHTIVAFILISFVVSLVGRPIVKIISKVRIYKYKMPMSVCAMGALLILWIIFIGFFSFFIPLLIREFQSLSSVDLQSIISAVEGPTRQLMRLASSNPVGMEHKSFLELIQDELKNLIDFSRISVTLGTIVGAIGNILITFFSVSFISFFFLKDENMFLRGVLMLVPSGYEERIERITNSVVILLRRYFIGLFFEITLIMILVTVGLLIVGIGFSHAVVIGLICGVFNVIPYLGPWLGAIIGLVIGVALNLQVNFVHETLPLLGYMLIVFGTVHLIDNIVFQPVIYSSSVKAHPLEIFIVIFAAGSMAGVMGMIVAIPFYTLIRVVAQEFLGEWKLVKGLTGNLNEIKGEK